MKIILQLICFPLPLVPQKNPSFPKVSHLPTFQAEQLPKLPPLFLLTPIFSGYLSSQVRINKLVNSVLYHPSPSFEISLKDTSFHISINSLGLYHSLQDACWISPHTFIFHHSVKNFKFMEFTFLENALIRGVFTHDPLYSKFAPKFLSSRARKKEITSSPMVHSFKNLFPRTVERDGGNYDFPQACNFTKKGTLVQVFSFEFC